MDKGIRPAARVRALAAAGHLVDGDDKLEPFVVSDELVRKWSRRERDRRAGNIKTTATDKPLPAVVDDLTTRLTNLAVSEVTLLETAAKKAARTGKPIDTVRLQRAIRTVRELAALIPGENAPPRPGRGPAKEGDAPTRTGLAAAILAADAKAPGAMTATPTSTDRPEAIAPSTSTEGQRARSTSAETPAEGQEHQRPGAWAEAEEEGLPVGREALA